MSLDKEKVARDAFRLRGLWEMDREELINEAMRLFDELDKVIATLSKVATPAGKGLERAAE